MKAVVELGPVVLHTVILYIFLILGLRLLGRRQRSELTTTELVIVAMLGSAVETSLVAGNKTLAAGLVSAGTLFAANHCMAQLVHRSKRLRRWLIGQPIPLVYRGQFVAARIREAGLTEDDVSEGIRQRGYEDVNRIELAMLEMDGSISVVAKEGLEKDEAG